jgi:sulfur carrier protein
MSAAAESIALSVNGEPWRGTAGATVGDLLRQLGLDARLVAVELNGEILPRGERAARPLRAGDRLEVVRFVQGG